LLRLGDIDSQARKSRNNAQTELGGTRVQVQFHHGFLKKIIDIAEDEVNSEVQYGNTKSEKCKIKNTVRAILCCPIFYVASRFSVTKMRRI